MASIILRIITPLVTPSEDVLFPVDAFIPCNKHHASCFWPVFVHQAIGTGAATMIHACKDSMISGFLLTICSQLDVLKLRLTRISALCQEAIDKKESAQKVYKLERKLISECVRDHQSIFKWVRYFWINETINEKIQFLPFRFIDILNESLMVMLFGQVATTMPNLCLSVYALSTTNITSLEFVMTTQFLSAVVIELFFFCWFGNEVTVHVSDCLWTSKKLKRLITNCARVFFTIVEWILVKLDI